MQWLADNREVIEWVLYVVVPAVMALLVKWGLVEKKAKEKVEEGIEDVRPLLELAIANANQDKLTPKRIADMCIHAVKTRVREKIATAPESVQKSVADGAAKCDPDPEKRPRPVLRFLGGLVKAVVLKR
jgi:hypothetical protein